MQQLKTTKILIFFLFFTCSLFSNEKNPNPKTSCEKEDCKIQVQSKEKNKLPNSHRENVLSIQRNLNKIKNQSFQSQETEKKWLERMETELHKEERLKRENGKVLGEIYNKEMKFSATGN